MQAQGIINNLNIISEKLFKTLENQIYDILDKILVITPDVLKQESIKGMFLGKGKDTILLIANTMLLFYLIHYIIKQLICLYNGNEMQNIWKFVIKIVIVFCLISNSYYICEQILTLFSLFTDIISSLLKDISGKGITFSLLKDRILLVDDIKKADLLSLSGIIKSMLSVGTVSILVNFSIRYVTIIFLIIISPFAFLTITSESTKGIFYSWIKILIINLFIQVIVKFIIVIPAMYKSTNDVMYKVILLGAIYIIYRINPFVREIFSKINITR